MDVKLKQRLTGAVILTSLAIIILPLLLNGTKEERAKVVAAIPDPPRIELDAITVEDITGKMAQMQRSSEASLPQEVVDETDYENAEDFILDKNQLPVSWSIQLGSFKSRDNAVNLRATLREFNYRTYILHARTNEGEVYRVFVGPMVSKGALAEMGVEIEAKLHLKGRIVRYKIEEDIDQLGG